jgi:hypothetical protein
VEESEVVSERLRGGWIPERQLKTSQSRYLTIEWSLSPNPRFHEASVRLGRERAHSLLLTVINLWI